MCTGLSRKVLAHKLLQGMEVLLEDMWATPTVTPEKTKTPEWFPAIRGCDADFYECVRVMQTGKRASCPSITVT